MDDKSNQIVPASNENTAGAVTRRSFIRIAVGTLVSLPAVAGGVRLPFVESGPTTAEAAEATIITAKPTETIIVVMDVNAGANKPLQGAKVKIKSCFNGKTREGVSDEKGVVKLDIAELSEDDGKKKCPPTYAFYAEIEVLKDGYRKFRTGQARVEGAKGVAAPTRPTTPGVVYPSRVTFDDWDVLYTANEFCVTAKNDMRHNLKIELEEVKAGDKVHMALFANDTEMGSTTATANNGSVTVELLEQYLLKGAKKVLPADANFSLRFDVNGTNYRVPLALKVCTAKGGWDAPGVDRNFSLSPFSEGAGGHKGVQISLPSSLPLVGGTPIKIWTPEFENVAYGFDPFGYAYIAIRTSEYGYKSKNGKNLGAKDRVWQSHPRGTVAEQFNKMTNDISESFMSTALAVSGRKGKVSHVNLLRKFSTTVVAQLSLVAKWGNKTEDLIRVRAGAQVSLAIDFSLSWQFLAGPVPLVFEFALNTIATVGLNIAASTTKFKDPKAWAIDYTNSALSLTIDISPSISLGVGIRGVASVSIKGVYTLTFFVGMTALPANRPKDVTNPHLVLGMGYNLSLVLQFLFFTVPIKLPGDWNEPHFYDNWKGGYKSGYKPQSQSDLMAQAESISMIDAIENALTAEDPEEQLYVLGDDDFESMAQDEEEWEIDYDDLSYQYEDGTVAKIDYTTKEVACTITGTDVASSATIVEMSFSRPDENPSLGGMAAGSTAGLSAAADEMPTLTKAQISPKESLARAYLDRPAEIVKAGVSKAGTQSGLVPAAVERFNAGVFGDPRAEVRNVMGATFVFRIASVKVKAITGRTAPVPGYPQGAPIIKEVTRPRVVFEAQVNNRRRTFTADFNSQELYSIDRSYLYDYDYDVLVEDDETNSSAANVYIVIFSLIKERNDETGTREQLKGYLAGNQAVTVLHLWINKVYNWNCITRRETGLLTSRESHGERVFDPADTKGTDFSYSNYSCPKLMLLKDTVGSVSRKALCVSFLQRAAKTPEGIMSKDPNEVRLGYGSFYISADGYGGSFAIGDDYINQTVFTELKDRSIYHAESLPRCGIDKGAGVGWRIVMLRGIYTYYFLVEDGAAARKETAYIYWPGSVREPKLIGIYDPDAERSGNTNYNLRAPAYLVPWPNHDGYLASMGGKLVHVTLKGLERPKNETNEKYRVPEPRFEFNDIGPTNFSITTFGTDETGEFLYWPAVREGVPGYEYSKEGEGNAREEVEEHRVLSSRLRGGKFGKPFVFCQVPYDMDTLVTCGSQKSVAMSFLSTNLTDRRRGIGEVRYTAMPYVRCANAIGIQTVGEYAFPGVKCPFNVTIRNEGNVPLSGCTIRLHKRGAKDNKLDTLTKITFNKQTLIASNYNPKMSDGTLKDVEPDYALAPGQTSVYAVQLKVPSNWEGKVQASVTAQDFVAAPKSPLITSSDSSTTTSLATFADDTDVEGEGTINFGGEDYNDIDPETYSDDFESIDFEEYAEPQTEYDEDGNEYVDYIITPEDFDEIEDLEVPYDVLTVSTSDDVSGDDLGDAVVEVDTGWNGWEDADAVGSLEPLPQTGDDMGPGVASAILGGLGAAMVAYSKRRMENERTETANTGDKSDD